MFGEFWAFQDCGAPFVVRVFICILAAVTGVAAAPLGEGSAISDWKTDWKHDNGQGVYAIRNADYVRLGNEYLERVFRVSEGVVRTAELVNKVGGKELSSQDEPEFGLEVEGQVKGELGTPDFKLVDLRVTDSKDGSVQCSFVLEYRPDAALKVTEVVETYAHRRYQRKWLLVDWSGDGDVTVKRIDVEEILFGWWYVAEPSHLGYGQPVFVGDLYLGLEYPGAETGQAGYTYLRHYPGRSAKGGLKSKTEIWGVAEDAAHVRKAFFEDYLSTMHPQPARPSVLYNLLGIGMPEKNKLIHWVNVIGPEARKVGLKIDSFVIDDGWQDETTVWRLDETLFPGGFTSLVKTISGDGAQLGLWLAPDGFTLDTRWGNLRGLEVSHLGQRGGDGRYCIAGPHYLAALKQILGGYLLNEHVNYFKFDYNVFGCDVPTHGHPVGQAGRDAQIDAYIELLRYLKSISPDVRIAITTGMWLSPWWTLDEDWAWLGGSDMGSEVTSLTPQDSVITYRDSILYDDFRVKKYVFPFSAVMTHGFWVLDNTPFPQFKDDCMITIGRGISDWEILTSPQNLDSKRYEFLSRAISWGKANWEILSHTEMILGDPSKGEIYGYRHAGKGAILVILRNPSLTSRIIELTGDDLGTAGGKNRDSLVAFETYPAYVPLDWDREGKAGLQVEVLGAQTKVVVVAWDKSLSDRLRF